MVDVTIKQVGRRDNQDRFVLVEPRTRKILTANDVSEPSLRRFFERKGIAAEVFDGCLQTARQRYEQSKSEKRVPVDQGAETIGDEDVLFELGLDDESDASIH